MVEHEFILKCAYMNTERKTNPIRVCVQYKEVCGEILAEPYRFWKGGTLLERGDVTVRILKFNSVSTAAQLA